MAGIGQLSTHISGQQLLFVVDAGHGNLPLTYHGEVIRVGRDEEHLWRVEACLFAVVLTVDELVGLKNQLSAPISSGLWPVWIW